MPGSFQSINSTIPAEHSVVYGILKDNCLFTFVTLPFHADSFQLQYRVYSSGQNNGVVLDWIFCSPFVG